MNIIIGWLTHWPGIPVSHITIPISFRIKQNLYKKGHLPVLGEWFALQLIAAAGSKEMGDEVFNQIFHPVAINLISFCTAVLRVGGPSKGADEMISTGQTKGKIIYHDIREIPDLKNWAIEWIIDWACAARCWVINL